MLDCRSSSSKARSTSVNDLAIPEGCDTVHRSPAETKQTELSNHGLRIRDVPSPQRLNVYESGSAHQTVFVKNQTLAEICGGEVRGRANAPISQRLNFYESWSAQRTIFVKFQTWSATCGGEVRGRANAPISQSLNFYESWSAQRTVFVKFQTLQTRGASMPRSSSRMKGHRRHRTHKSSRVARRSKECVCTPHFVFAAPALR